MSGEGGGGENRRRIKLETRHGGSRESRSRRDRPCDICRTRKSACVITIKPPCRFCETRGLECTFDTGPRPRHQRDTEIPGDLGISKSNFGNVFGSPINSRASPKLKSEITRSMVEERTSAASISNSNDRLYPQALEFPISQDSRPTFSTVSPHPHSVSSVISSSTTDSDLDSQPSTRQYLSLQELASSPEDTRSISSPVEIHRRPIVVDRKAKELSIQESERARDSLEYGKKTTAHFIGISGEQDTDLFAAIRYNVLNETKFIDFNVRQVFEGNPATGAPPIHFSILNDCFPSRDQMVKQAASDAIELHVRGHGDALVRLYFRFVHAVLPILSKAGFLMAYKSDKLSIPASLRAVVYGLGCAFWIQDSTLKDIPPISQPELFEQAHGALYRELDSPKLSTLQACLLVLHEQPDASGTTESPRIWVLACQATGCAQSLGLDQDPTHWKLPLWEKRLRKRLWWTAVVNDVWTSICHGNSMHITEDTYDTTDLTLEDLISDEYVVGLPGSQILENADQIFQPSNASRFLEIVKISKVLSGVLRDTCSLKAYSQIIQKEGTVERQQLLVNYNAEADKISALLPEGLHMMSPLPAIRTNGFFHIASFALKAIILRQMMSPATPESKSDPNSNLRKHFELALAEGEAFVQFATKLFSMDLNTFWPRHSRNNLIITTNHLIYLFFCASTEAHVSKAYNMLQRYQEVLTKAAKNTDWSTIGLIRPSILRADSFFHGAADSIRLGPVSQLGSY